MRLDQTSESLCPFNKDDEQSVGELINRLIWQKQLLRGEAADLRIAAFMGRLTFARGFRLWGKIFLGAHRDDDNEEEERAKKNCVNIFIYIVHVRFVILSGIDSFYRTSASC